MISFPFQKTLPQSSFSSLSIPSLSPFSILIPFRGPFPASDFGAVCDAHLKRYMVNTGTQPRSVGTCFDLFLNRKVHHICLMPNIITARLGNWNMRVQVHSDL